MRALVNRVSCREESASFYFAEWHFTKQFELWLQILENDARLNKEQRDQDPDVRSLGNSSPPVGEKAGGCC